MSVSVTVSMADDRIGMFSPISRVNWVRVSAWLGKTLDSSGAIALLGRPLIPAPEALLATAKSLVAHGLA